MGHSIRPGARLGTTRTGPAGSDYYDYIENGKLTGGRILVDLADPDQRATFGFDGQAARGQWPVTTVIDNGPSSNRIDIVVLGDGYTESEMGI